MNNRYLDEHSRYCYLGTNVLRNNANIRNINKLNEFESIMTIARISDLLDTPIEGNFNTPHLKQIHYYIFQDVYPFAGELRIENISKGSFVFAQVRFMESALASLFTELKQENHLQNLSKLEFTKRSAYYLTELNVIHPFREGNCRVIREFIRCLAANTGFELDWSQVPPKKILDASIQSVRDDKQLIEVIQCIHN